MYNVKKNRLLFYLILLPSLIAIIVFVYGFIIWSIRVSFSSWEGLVQKFDFIGLRNFINLFQTQRFQINLWNTLYFTIFFLAISVFTGLILAIILDKKIKGESIFRNIFLFPMAISFVVTGIVWKWIFNPSVGINAVLDFIGLGGLKWGWFTDPSKYLNFHIALIPIIIAASWRFSGYTMALYLAALRSIPEEIREAARIDGASEFQIYARIILPMLKPVTFSALIILGHISLKIFDLVFTMTGSGPAFATDVPGINMWMTSFRANRFAMGASIAIVMFILVSIVVIPYLFISLRRKKN